MDALQHAILFNATQNKHDEEELKPLNFEPSEEFIDGVPLCLKIETLQNQLSETLDKQKEKLVELQNSNKPDRAEQIFVIKRNINLICELRSVPIISLQDYEYAEWCYNGGKFRTPDEIIEKQNEIAVLNEQKRIAEVRSSKSFNKHYHPILWFLAWFLIPPIVLGIIWEGFKAGVIVGLFIWAFAFIPFAIIAAIATWIYCSVHASIHNVPMSTFEKEAIIGCTAAGVTMFHYGKKRIDNESKQKSKEV